MTPGTTDYHKRTVIILESEIPAGGIKDPYVPSTVSAARGPGTRRHALLQLPEERTRKAPGCCLASLVARRYFVLFAGATDWNAAARAEGQGRAARRLRQFRCGAGERPVFAPP
ncbi:hypothetical protein [Dactylosporangium sp. CA-233914]|uniref:hypothetical protein n=1 Tax=Dactylosporangium sp. CA-233914 TaxID=3239934 RepID=UPI003D907C40